MAEVFRLRWRVPIIAAAAHAAAVVLALAVNVASVRMNVAGGHGLDAVADAMVWVLCLPLVSLLKAGRVDIFFLLLPLNTIVYAVVFWVVLGCIGKLGMRTV